MADLSRHKAWPGKERVSAEAWNDIIDAIGHVVRESRAGDIRIHIGFTGHGSSAYPRPSDKPSIYPVQMYCGFWRPRGGIDTNPGSWECDLDPQDSNPIKVFAAVIGEGKARYLPYGSPVVVLEVCGQYWCAPCEPILYQFRLDDCLFPGGSAPAYLQVLGADIPGQIVVYDRLGVFHGSNGDKGICYWDYFTSTYVIVFISGTPCSESSFSDSRSDSSTSESSTSESSTSESSASESSTSESSVSESSTSESQSGSSESQQSESFSEGSDKSTAIVPASWTGTGYTALFIHEMPEVRFDDILVCELAPEDTMIGIDPRFVEVCERDTIEVCGVSCDLPIAVGASVRGNRVVLRFAKSKYKRVRVVIRLTGIRRGFRGHRFPPRTRAQFEANERFIRSAYPEE